MIGHMKADGLLGKNWLKGAEGAALHALPCGAGHNLRMILRRLRVLYCAVLGVIAMAASQLWQLLTPSGSLASALRGRSPRSAAENELFRVDYLGLQSAPPPRVAYLVCPWRCTTREVAGSTSCLHGKLLAKRSKTRLPTLPAGSVSRQGVDWPLRSLFLPFGSL